MYSAKLSSILCASLCVGLVTAEVHTVFNKTEQFNEVHNINIRNSLMTTVVCDAPIDYPVPIKKCNITHTTMDNQGKSASCPTILGSKISGMSAHPLTENKAVLIAQTTARSDDKLSNYVWVYNFPDCKNIVTKITFESFSDAKENYEENRDAILINEDGTFDVLYNDAKLCGDKLCRLSFDAEGNKVKGPIASFVPVAGAYRMIKKVPFSPDFFVIELKADEGYRVSLLKPSGLVVLKDYETYDDVNDHDVSMLLGSIRLCSQTDTTKVECGLLDYDSGKTIEKISVVAPQTVETVTIANLANDEFLLLGENDETSTLMKVKGDGSIIGVTELSHFASDVHESYLVAESNRYCVTRQSTRKGNLKILKECYDDSDLH